MRIAIDVQGIQSEGSRTRGIGRYSYETVLNLVNHFPEEDFVIFLNASLPNLPPSLISKLAGNNVSFVKWFAPCPFDYLSYDNDSISIATLLRSYTLRILELDVLIITSYFEGFADNILVDIDKEFVQIPVVSIFYDLIPLINSELYLDKNPEFSKYYFSKIEKIKKLDGLLAISESSLNEAFKYLEFNSQNLFNISSACNNEIFNTNEVSKSLCNLDVDGIGSYILYSGACDPRKNLHNLVKSYSLISPELSSKYKLVFAGKLLKQEIELIRNWISNYHIDQNNIIILGYVNDADLVTLYQKCSLFVFPSLHEGFGLPVLEAMSCGAPVISSNLTSLPEIVSLEEAMFNPKNVIEIKSLMEKALTDNVFRDLLLDNSDKQCKRFSWYKTAGCVMDACRNIVDEKKNNYSKDWKIIRQDQIDILDRLLSILSSFNLSSDRMNQISASIQLINLQSEEAIRTYLPVPKSISWIVEGPFDSNYSLAILNRYFVESLSKVVEKVSIHITEGLGDYAPNLDFLKRYTDLYKLYISSQKTHSDITIRSRNLYPPRVNDLNERLNLIHSYGWEESELPERWVEEFNSHLQGISVMSSYVRKVLIDNGVKTPIFVTGLGLDHLNNIKGSTEIFDEDGKYTFLHVSSCFPRKGVDILLRAFNNNFTSNDLIKLVIKTFDNQHNYIDELIEKYRFTNPLFPQVDVIKEDLSEAEMKSLYLSANALVAPSRGEGFGLPIGEAMCLGIPVITTGYGGQRDFCNDHNSWLIDFQFKLAKSHFNQDLSFWAEPSCAHLGNLMKHLFSLSKNEIAKKTQIAKDQLQTFTWDKVAKDNYEFAKGLLKSKYRNEPVIGIVSTWNSRCGIASYSKNLTKNILSQIKVFTPYEEEFHQHNLNEDELNEDNHIKIIPSWDNNGSKGQKLTSLGDKIIDSGVTSVVVQFNFGFFDFTELAILIERMIEVDIKVFILMHATIDSENLQNKKLVNIKYALSCCQRILVHTISDLNRLKHIGLIDNVTLFKHGIIDFEHLYRGKIGNFIDKLSRNIRFKKRVAAYGFCLPNKGFEQLILAVKSLKEKQFILKLNLYCAIYSKEYESYFDKLNDLISELGIKGQVTLDGRYMNETKSLKLLRKNDLIIYPYQQSNESSSAAVRHGLATLKPVLVTPLPIFDDVSSCVTYLPGISSEEIAVGIQNWYSNNTTYNQNYNDEQITIIEQRRFSNVGIRLENMIKSIEIND